MPFSLRLLDIYRAQTYSQSRNYMYAELQISYHRGCYDNYEGPPDEMDHMAQRCFD